MSPPVSGGTAPSLLERVDPAVKLVVFLVASLPLFVVFDPVTPTVLYVLALFGVVTADRIRPRLLVMGQVPFALFAFSLLAVNAVTRGGRLVGRVGPLSVTSDGLAIGASLAMRTLAIGVCALGFIGSTDPARLLISLHQFLRVPVRATYALLAAYRLLGDLTREWTSIRQAQAMRRPARTTRRIPRSPRAMAQASFALLVSALRRGERVAIALEQRGVGALPRTIWRPARLSRTDLWFSLAVGTAVAAAFAVTIQLGVFRSFGALAG